MTKRRALTLLLLSSCAMLACAARADIGGIGSPVKPSNPVAFPPDKTPAPQTSATEPFDTEGRTPLLVIRFNQQHVYFDRVLRQAVEATNKAKPGATYDVVSMTPAGGTLEQSERINANAADNLNSVVQSLQNLGVAPSQIRVSTQSSSTAVVQEVDIFVD